MATQPRPEAERFLPQLTEALVKLDHDQPLSVTEFVNAVDKIMPIFDHLGTMMYFAKMELTTKRDSIHTAAQQFSTLHDLVAADIKKNTVTKKNSYARNLHRLLTTMRFIAEILRNMVDQPSWPLRQAVSEAYDKTLGPVHTWAVRTAVKAGMLTLPTRDHFLANIEETDLTAKAHADKYVAASNRVMARVESCYAGIKMPSSDVMFLHRAAA